MKFAAGYVAGMVVAAAVACGSSQTEKNAGHAGEYMAKLNACVAASETASVAQDCWCAVAKTYHEPCPGLRSDGGMYR